MAKEVSDIIKKLRTVGAKIPESFASCACALAATSALEGLNHAQVSMWSGTADPSETISILTQIKSAVKSIHNDCGIPVSQLYEDIDEIIAKINEPELESAANQIADLRIALLDDLFMCAGGDILDIRSSDRRPTEETERER